MAVSGSSGGGGGADRIRAGAAFVELTADDDELKRRLKEAQQKVTDMQKHLARPMLRPMLRDFAQLSMQSDVLNKRLGLEEARAKLANPMLRPMLREMALADKAMAKLNKQFEFEQLRARVGTVRAHLQSIADKAKKIGHGVAFAGAGITAGGAAIVAPLAAAFKGMLDRSTEIAKLSTKLGVSTEQLSEFAYAAELTGQSFQDLEGHWENLAERVAQGATGGGEAAETFKKLGIDAGQLKLQNPVEQLITLAEAMRGVTNETERLGMLSSLGGDKFQGLNALFKQGPEGIRKMMGEAKTVGASVSSESAAAAVKTEQAFLRAWTSIKSIFWSVGEAFLPLVDTLQAGVSLFVGLIGGVRAFIQNNKILVMVLAGVGLTLAAIGVGVIALGGIITAFGAVASAVGTIVGVAWSPITLTILGVGLALVAITAIVAGLTYAFFKFTEVGKLVGSSLGEMFGNMWATAKQTFGGIADAMKAGNFSLAWKIATKGLHVIWKDFVIGMKSAWNEFLKWYFTKTMDAVKAVAKAFGLDDLAERVTGSEEEGKKKFLEIMGFDLDADIARRDQLKRELDALIQQAKPKEEFPGAVGGHGNMADYLPKLTERIKGLFQAPDLNRALSYGDNVNVDRATIQTAKNTGVIANEIKRLEPATFK